MTEFIIQYGGLIFAVLGMALVVAIPGINSGKGVGMVGEVLSI